MQEEGSAEPGNAGFQVLMKMRQETCTKLKRPPSGRGLMISIRHEHLSIPLSRMTLACGYTNGDLALCNGRLTVQ